MTAPQPVPGPYALAASVYWAAGWRGIIPVRGKWPPPSGWTGAEGGWPSYPDLRAWADGPEGAQNIALRLPGDVLGVDVDAYGGKAGATTLAACEATWGPLPATWRSTSRDDGVSGIRLYRVSPGLGWPGEIHPGGIEIIQMSHRYCVAWPSRHPEGRTYRWIDPDGAIMASAVPRPADLPALPAAWVDGLSRGPARDRMKTTLPEGQAAWLLGLSGAEEPPCPRLRSAGEQIARSFGSANSRHEAAKAGVLGLINRAEQGHPGIVPVLRLVGDAFVLAVRDDRGVDTAWGEWARLVDGAVKIVANEPRTPDLGDPCIVPSDPPWHPGDPLPAEPGQLRPTTPATAPGSAAAHTAPPAETLIVVDSAVTERLRFHRADREAKRILDAEANPLSALPDPVGGVAFLGRPIVRPPSRIGSVLPIGARFLLTAQMKAGKTTLVGNLIRSLCDGTPFLGFEVTPPDGPVVLIDLEMDPITLQRWLKDMRIQHPERLHVVSLVGRVRAFDIRDPRVFEHWVRVLRGLGAAVLVIDCLKPILDYLGLDERAETGLFTTPLTQLMKEALLSELGLVHHMGHFGERARGDSALRGWPEVEWQLVREAKNPDVEAAMDADRYFKAYGRDVNVPESRILYDPPTRSLSLNGGNREAARAARTRDNVQAALLELVGADPGIMKGTAATELRRAGHKIGNAEWIRLVGDLVGAGRLREVLGGSTNKAHLLYLNNSPKAPGELGELGLFDHGE